VEREKLVKLRDEIKARLNQKKLEKIQSVLNEILEEVLQKQGLSENEGIIIEITLNSTQPQFSDTAQEQEAEKALLVAKEEQLSLVGESQQASLAIEAQKVVLMGCVIDPATGKVKCT
jgi:hypothetical protein